MIYMVRVLILTTVLYFAMISCSTKDSANHTFSIQRDSTVVKTRTFYAQVKGYGRIGAAQAEVLSVRFNGHIRFPQQRAFYAQGTVIYRLTGPDVERQKTRLNNALAKAQAKLDFASAVYNRKKDLIKKKVLAPKERDEIIYNYRAAQEDLKQAQAELNYFLQMTGYKAPYDGYLSAVSVSQNDYVQKGQILARFQSFSRLKLMGTLYGDSASFITQGCALRVELNGKMQTAAKIIFLEQNINLQSGGRAFWAEIDSVPPTLKPGDYVHYILKGPAFRAPAVPASALILEKGRYYAVMCVNGQYQNEPVLPGLNTRGFVEIKTGLKAGDTVLTTGAFEAFHRNLQKNLKIAD